MRVDYYIYCRTRSAISASCTLLFIVLALMNTMCKHATEPPPDNTPDTTSHNFSWSTEKFGEGGSSILYDVALINDTLAYAGGEIHLRDSTGQVDPVLYNLAVWNGRRWTISRLPYIDQGVSYFSPIYWLCVISPTDIWFSNSVHWDGSRFHNVNIATSIFYGVGTKKMWANPAGEMYVVGYRGTIAYSSDHGSSWHKLESGTTLDFYDIWGGWSEASKQWEVLALGSSHETMDNALVQVLPNGAVQSIGTNGLSFYSTGIWFVPQEHYYIVGSGIHQKNTLRERTWRVYQPGEVTSYASSAVRGQNQNDVFVTGSFLEVVHYNGSTWYNYKNEIPFGPGALADVDIKGNTVVIVGYAGAQAIAFVGKR